MSLGVNVLGIVENMADIKIPFQNLLNPDSGIKLVNAQGEDVTQSLMHKIQEHCPELLHTFIESHLFKLPENASNNMDLNTAADETNPRGMARKFNVPYLGKMPMDPNMMRACEEGKSFLDAYPTSVAAAPFADIVNQIVNITSQR